jgi:TonB-linked SusC/RagA family outer membrane protein
MGKLALILIFMGFSVFTYAQQKISGTVTDSEGQPIIGASVVIKEQANNGTVTDFDGNFTLNGPQKSTLIISYVGYITQTVPYRGTALKVVLKEDTELLEEVVVVGYGTMKKSDLTGSTTQLKTDAITATVAANPLTSLQGKSSGVAVFTNNKPGATPTIRVRGTGTINSSSDPLYVVDGFPLMDGNLNDINASDIESMEVLKDASSTAIYGSRGANGVIMITTKKGTKGTKNCSINLSTGVQMRARLMDLLSGEDYLEYTGASAPANGKYTNWQKEVIQSTALTQDYNVTFDGNSNGTSYMISAGYYDQDGLISAQGYEKYSIHSNLTHKYNKWLTIGSSIQFTSSTQNVFDNALGDISRGGYPTEPVRNEDGTYNIISGSGCIFNPLADIDATTNRNNRSRFLGNFFAEVAFNKHLSYKLSIGYDLTNSRSYKYESSQMASAISKNAETGVGSHSWYKNRSKLMDNIITYQNQWGDHRVTVTGVYSYQDYKYESIGLGSSAFDNDLLGAWKVDGKELSSWSTNIYSNKLISFTGRATYAYKDKYLLTATARYDGSSRFGADNKWGLFPSVGLAWRATEEEFLKDNEIITDLKIRGSWGITGNQEIGNYKSLPQLSAGKSYNYSDGTSALPGYGESVGNSSLKWERTTQIDLGFDLSLWNRVHLNFDYYQRVTRDLLYESPIPSSSGFSTVMSNVGKVANHGVEFTVRGDIYKNQDWTVDASFNVTYNKNKIRALYDDVTRVASSPGNTGIARILEVGYPVNSVWARKSLGIIKTQEQLDEYLAKVPGEKARAQLGAEMYEDVNGDGSISVDDFVCLGSTEPKVYYGINVGAQYKKFKLSLYGQGAAKYASALGAEDGFASAIGYASNSCYTWNADNQIAGQSYIPTTQAYKNWWSESNPNGTYPAAGTINYFSTRTNANWHYFILKNIQMSYDFTSLTRIKTLKKLTLNVNLQNFFANSTTRGYNPENGDVSNPWAKIVMFGISAKF